MKGTSNLPMFLMCRMTAPLVMHPGSLKSP